MNILLVMVPLSIVLLIGAGIAFFWAVEHDQFDDMDTPALLPLLDVPFEVEISSDEDDQTESLESPPPAANIGDQVGDREYD